MLQIICNIFRQGYICNRSNRGFCCDASRGNQKKFPSHNSTFLVKARNSLQFIQSKIPYHVHNLFQFWTRRSQTTPFHPVSLGAILILTSHLYVVLRGGFFPSGFPTKSLYAIILCPTRATCTAYLSLFFILLSEFHLARSTIMKILIILFSPVC